MKKKTKKYLKYQGIWLVTLFVTLTASWFVWKTWERIDNLLGNSILPYIVAGIIVLVAVIFGIGHFTFKKFVEKFK